MNLIINKKKQMQSWRLKKKLWQPFLDNFEKFVFPSIEILNKSIDDRVVDFKPAIIKKARKEQTIKNFYWFGARMSGKTWNTFQTCLYAAAKYKKITFSLIVCRLNKMDLLETYKWFRYRIPDSLKDKNYNESMKFFEIKVRNNLSIQFIHIFGYHRRESQVEQDHFLKGFSLQKADVRFVIVEESDKLPKGVESALNLICRDQFLTFNFFIFNNYVKTFPMVAFVEEKLPWNALKMGTNLISIDRKNKFTIAKEVTKANEFWMENVDEDLQAHFWRISFFAILFDKKVMPDEIDAVYQAIKNDPFKKQTILFGKAGNPKASIYSPVLGKIKREDAATFLYNSSGNLECWVGIDLGYSKDKTALAVVFFDKDNNKFFLERIKTWSPKNVGPGQKYREIAQTILTVWNAYKTAHHFEIIFVIDSLYDIIACIGEELKKLNIRQHCDYRHFSGREHKPKIEHRVTKISFWLETEKLTFNSHPYSEIEQLLDEMDEVQWRYNHYIPDMPKSREGVQDCIEALENALFFNFWTDRV